MQHSLRHSRDKYHILCFLNDFSIWNDCQIVVYQTAEIPVYSCLYPRGGKQDLWQFIHEKLGQNIGPEAYVKFQNLLSI